jgi:CheY-like chemotaxis protein
MCVEDDPDIRMILEFSLTMVGNFEVCLCPSGEAALAQAPTFKPDIVLLDVMMPDLTGPQTLIALRAQAGMKGVPVVFITAKAMPDEVEELLQYGVSGVMVKPFDPVKLPQDLRMYWEHDRDKRAD